MGKRSKTTRRRRSIKPVHETHAVAREPAQGNRRNHTLDALRGLAIVLMVIDHAVFLFFDAPIDPGGIRIVTRLSMPLFCVLAGYFVDQHYGRFVKTQKEKGGPKEGGRWLPHMKWERVLQIALASFLVNLLYVPVVGGKLEILASMLICFVAFGLLGRWFSVLLFAFLIFPYDSTAAFLDFAISSVATCMAAGVILSACPQRWLGLAASLGVGLISGIGLAWGGTWEWVGPPTVYVLIALPLATILVMLAERFPGPRIPVLCELGRRPLTAYVAQYWLLILFSELLR